ncbi:MAG: Bro-N domain-containing protein [Bilophila wadsworthia]
MKMSNITPFAFGDNLVRSMTDENGNPWFVAKDVAVVLDIQNIRQNLSELDDDEKGVCTTYTPGGAQELKTVSESGLTRSSSAVANRKPKAFSKWVRSSPPRPSQDRELRDAGRGGDAFRFSRC